MNQRPAFHLAFPVNDLVKTELFYTEVLGCAVGRRSEQWIDFNFYGHQIVAHLVKQKPQQALNPVDNKTIPIPHFGVILEWKKWEVVAKSLAEGKVEFIVEPYIRFRGQSGEQATLFFYDPCGNAIEIKAFRNDDDIFRV